MPQNEDGKWQSQVFNISEQLSSKTCGFVVLTAEYVLNKMLYTIIFMVISCFFED